MLACRTCCPEGFCKLLHDIVASHAFERICSGSSSSSNSSASAAQWLDALVALGAHTWPPLLHRPVVVPRAEAVSRALASEHAAADAPAGSGSATKYSAVDVACPEFERIVEELGTTASHKRMQQQLLLLQKLMAQKLEGREFRDAMVVRATACSLSGSCKGPSISGGTGGGGGSGRGCGTDASECGRDGMSSIMVNDRADASDEAVASVITMHSSFARALRELPWLLSDDGEPKAAAELFVKEHFFTLLSDKVGASAPVCECRCTCRTKHKLPYSTGCARA